MKWTPQAISRIEDKKIRERLLDEYSKSRSPLTGSIDYWHQIVHNRKINFRTHPHLYRSGKGQQGVLTFEPYKSEILPFWKFKDQESALASADAIYLLFEDYLSQEDFPGADMAKKYLHMGFTRARRYANHSDGKKYDKTGRVKKQGNDALVSEKARAAEIFKVFYDEARTNSRYLKLKKHFDKETAG